MKSAQIWLAMNRANVVPIVSFLNCKSFIVNLSKIAPDLTKNTNWQLWYIYIYIWTPHNMLLIIHSIFGNYLYWQQIHSGLMERATNKQNIWKYLTGLCWIRRGCLLVRNHHQIQRCSRRRSRRDCLQNYHHSCLRIYREAESLNKCKHKKVLFMMSGTEASQNWFSAVLLMQKILRYVLCLKYFNLEEYYGQP